MIRKNSVDYILNVYMWTTWFAKLTAKLSHLDNDKPDDTFESFE